MRTRRRSRSPTTAPGSDAAGPAPAPDTGFRQHGRPAGRARRHDRRAGRPRAGTTVSGTPLPRPMTALPQSRSPRCHPGSLSGQARAPMADASEADRCRPTPAAGGIADFIAAATTCGESFVLVDGAPSPRWNARSPGDRRGRHVRTLQDSPSSCRDGQSVMIMRGRSRCRPARPWPIVHQHEVGARRAARRHRLPRPDSTSAQDESS